MEQIQTARKKNRPLQRKSSQGICQYALSGLGGLILGGGNFMGCGLPLGCCLISAQPPGGRAIGATIGAVVGYFLRCEPAEAVEYTAVSLLMLFTLFLFQGTSLPEHRWFMPLCCSLICAIMGGVRLLGSVEVTVVPWLGKAVLGAIGTHIFRKAMGGHKAGWVILAGAMVFSLNGVGRYIDVGLLCAVLVACITGEILPGAVMGMALDLGEGMTSSMTFVMVIPGIFCKLLSVRKSWLKSIIYALCPIVTLVALGAGELHKLLGVVLGAAGGYVLSRSPILTPEVTTSEEKDRQKAPEQAAAVLDALGMELPNQPKWKGKEAERIFDGVGERVCRRCPMFRHCWEKNSQKTYGELSVAAKGILNRGIACEEDFSKEFRERCCAFPAFLSAVNGELEGILYRRRYYRELKENRRILEQEYRLLAQFLRETGTGNKKGAERRFTPLVSICSARKTREKVCGDRGVCFLAPDGNYYVILCDGMGTGIEAARLSSYAVRLLEKLLRCGLAPEAAMSLLNGNMILRGSGTFSTVDLLRLDLYSGMAYIYKWGAAPSFWREGEQVRKIGNPTPPPGVGIDQGELPEIFKLPMKDSQLLVLISDGAYCEETEGVVGAYRSSSPRDLAALLISSMEGDDDMTAIVVSLERRTT